MYETAEEQLSLMRNRDKDQNTTKPDMPRQSELQHYDI